MQVIQIAFVMLAAMLLPTAAFAQAKPAPDDAYLYFVWPQDGTVIKGGFWCRFGLRNMGVTHAGDDFPNSGHHHLLIDVMNRSIQMMQFPRTKTIFISAQDKPRHALSYRRASTHFSLCSAMPSIFRLNRPSSQKRSRC